MERFNQNKIDRLSSLITDSAMSLKQKQAAIDLLDDLVTSLNIKESTINKIRAKNYGLNSVDVLND